MAPQSAKRDRKNQGFPLCHEHAVGDVVPVRELPYGPAARQHQQAGQMAASDYRRYPNLPLASSGASTDDALGSRAKAVAIQIDHSTTHAQEDPGIGQVFQTRNDRSRAQCAV